MKHVQILAALTFLSVMTLPVSAKPTEALVRSFISASEQARQKQASTEAINHYLSFFKADFTDHHPTYGVLFKGTENLKNGIISKGASMVSVEEVISDIVLGTDTAVVVVNEDSKYYKNERLKHFKGRTILVLEFDQDDLITNMRRYID